MIAPARTTFHPRKVDRRRGTDPSCRILATAARSPAGYDPAVTSNVPIEPAELHIAHSAGAADAPTLLFLHGLGGTGAVWGRVAALADWPGDVVLPDLRGHGASPWTRTYSFGAMASDVAGLLPEGRPVVAVGHSMGGAVALALASGWFGVEVASVYTVGIKVEWTDEELAGIPLIASKPPREFDDEAGAREWAAKLAGLYGVVELDDPILDRAISPAGAGWRAALDPRAGLVGPPPLRPLHHAMGDTPVMHTLGENDHMVDEATAASMGAPVEVFAGAGHNAMVERPDAVWASIERFCRP